MEQFEPLPGREQPFAADPVASRVIADVAAAAATESDLYRLILAVGAPLERLVPGAVASFGLLTDDRVIYPNALGETVRDIATRYRPVDESGGQVTGPGRLLPTISTQGRLEVETFSITAAKAGGATLGYLFVGSLVPGFEFSPRHLAALRVLAQIAGPAMHHAWRAQERAEEADEHRVVAAVAAVAARGGGPDQIVDALRDALQPLIELPFVGYAQRTGSGYTWYGTGAPPTGDPGRSPAGGGSSDGLQGEVLGVLAANAVHRFTLTPVTVDAQPTGFLLAGSRSPRYEFSLRHRSILGVVAQIVGPAVANALAKHRLQEEAEEQRAIAVVAAAAAREADGLALLEQVRSTLTAFVPSPAVSFAYVDGDAVMDLAPGGDPGPRQLSDVERVAIAESSQQVGLAGSSGHAAAPVVVTPTRAGGQAQGILTVACGVPGFTFDGRTLRLIRLVAEIVGPALANHRAAAATARERELYQLILESLDEAVLLFDHGLNPSYGNRRARELFGAVAPAWEQMSPEQRLAALPGRPRVQLLAAIDGGVSRSGRTRMPLRNRVWVDYEFLPLDHPEYRLIAVADDVSEQVAGEQERKRQHDQMQQAARLAALGELVGGVAHELNNPLTAILGFAESLMTLPESRPLAEDLDVIHREALRARNIVRDLLFVVRPGAVERGAVELGSVARHVERLRQAAWDQAGISVAVEIAPGTSVFGNEHQLAQVALNLVTNAEQALEGRPNPRLEVVVAALPGGGASLEVRDNGGGIAEDVRARLFEPFFTTKKGIGTGLGLSLCQSIVQAHGGTIRVESEDGAGSVFRVELPPPPPCAAIVERPAMVTRTRPARVLILDDEPNIRTITRRVVRAIGHECDAAADVSSALALIENEEFDLLLCDYRLGRETAAAFIEHLASNNPAAIDRTVITTGATTDEGVLALISAHGLRILPKPFGRKDLEGLLDAHAA